MEAKDIFSPFVGKEVEVSYRDGNTEVGVVERNKWKHMAPQYPYDFAGFTFTSEGNLLDGVKSPEDIVSIKLAAKAVKETDIFKPFVGQGVVVTYRSGNTKVGVVKKLRSLCYPYVFGSTAYTQEGNYYATNSSPKDIVSIEPAPEKPTRPSHLCEDTAIAIAGVISDKVVDKLFHSVEVRNFLTEKILSLVEAELGGIRDDLKTKVVEYISLDVSNRLDAEGPWKAPFTGGK